MFNVASAPPPPLGFYVQVCFWVSPISGGCHCKINCWQEGGGKKLELGCVIVTLSTSYIHIHNSIYLVKVPMTIHRVGRYSNLNTWMWWCNGSHQLIITLSNKYLHHVHCQNITEFFYHSSRNAMPIIISVHIYLGFPIDTELEEDGCIFYHCS